MGLTAERVARHYDISREDQDAFALASHQKAVAAQAAGRFAEELVPVTVTTAVPGAKAGKPTVTERVFAADEGPRADTSAEALAKLKPAFHAQGTVTAGNSSQTSDGAAAVVLMDRQRAPGTGDSSRWAGWWPMRPPDACRKRWAWGRFTAIPKALKKCRADARPDWSD